MDILLKIGHSAPQEQRKPRHRILSRGNTKPFVEKVVPSVLSPSLFSALTRLLRYWFMNNWCYLVGLKEILSLGTGAHYASARTTKHNNNG